MPRASRHEGRTRRPDSGNANTTEDANAGTGHANGIANTELAAGRDRSLEAVAGFGLDGDDYAMRDETMTTPGDDYEIDATPAELPDTLPSESATVMDEGRHIVVAAGGCPRVARIQSVVQNGKRINIRAILLPDGN